MSTLSFVFQMTCVIGIVILAVGLHFGLKDENRDRRDYQFYMSKYAN